MIHYTTADLAVFEASVATCGKNGRWCSNSCHVLGEHILVVPYQGEMYGDTLARIQAERKAA